MVRAGQEQERSEKEVRYLGHPRWPNGKQSQTIPELGSQAGEECIEQGPPWHCDLSVTGRNTGYELG